MLYSNGIRVYLKNLQELASLQNHVEEVRLQDKLGKQNFHENLRKVFEPVTDTVENTSENLAKTLTESSVKDNQALENINDKLSKILNVRGIIASYLMSPLSIITKTENNSQLQLV